MGLDSYVWTKDAIDNNEKLRRERTPWNDERYIKESFYWRKHWRLHSLIGELFKKFEYPDHKKIELSFDNNCSICWFNGVEVTLTKKYLDAIKEAIDSRIWYIDGAPTIYDGSYSYEYETQDRNFIDWAFKQPDGTLIYDSSW